jgi:hypothetical protein
MNALTQLYSVDLIKTAHGNINFEDRWAAQLFPRSSADAQIVVTNPANALEGMIPLDTLIAGVRRTRLLSIQYTIIGTADGSKVHTQRYKHDFTSEVTVDRDLNLLATKGALFIPYQLDVLLDTRKFPKVTAIQFIA